MDLTPFEKDNVLDVYQKIHHEFSQTRNRQSEWYHVRRFLEFCHQDHIKKQEKAHHIHMLDAGCGNGRNMILSKKIWSGFRPYGIDFCENFVNEVQYKGYPCIHSSILNMPFPEQTFDVVISIAVIHHLSTMERRVQAIEECFRVLKPGGHFYYTLWSTPPKKDVSAVFGDNLVPWKSQNGTGPIYQRYYYIYTYVSAMYELTQIQCPFILKRMTEENGNICITLHKPNEF